MWNAVWKFVVLRFSNARGFMDVWIRRLRLKGDFDRSLWGPWNGDNTTNNAIISIAVSRIGTGAPLEHAQGTVCNRWIYCPINSILAKTCATFISDSPKFGGFVSFCSRINFPSIQITLKVATSFIHISSHRASAVWAEKQWRWQRQRINGIEMEERGSCENGGMAACCGRMSADKIDVSIMIQLLLWY